MVDSLTEGADRARCDRPSPTERKRMRMTPPGRTDPGADSRRPDRPPERKGRPAGAVPAETPIGDDPLHFRDPAPPHSADDSAAWDTFVHAWKDRVYALSLRFLGDRSAASDATQEIFLTLWRRRDHYDRTRPLKPWLYRVAMNTLRAERRRDRNRRKREREVAVIDRGKCEGDPLEEEERRRIVGNQLASLPDESRALLLLHYQHGLSQREIAETLGLRRSTVGDRLNRALETMRRSLRRGGHLAVIPLLEGTLGSTKLEAAPPLLTESLLAVPQTATAISAIGTAGSALTLGGLTMAKLTPTLLVCLCALSLAVGFGAGKVLDRGGATDSAAEERDPLAERFANLEAEHTALAADRDALAGALEQEKSANRAGEARIEDLVAQLAALKEKEKTDEASQTAPETIDWQALATAFESDADLLLWIGELMAQNLDPRTELPREERERFGALQKLWDSAATIARRDALHPFLDPDVLPPLASAVFAGPLGLDEAQKALLEAESARLLAEWPDAAEGTPLEAWQARRAILEGMHGSLEELLHPEQSESWDRLAPLSNFLLGGSERSYSIGLGGSEGVPGRVREDWNQHYRIRPEQQDRFESALSDYDRAVRGIMSQSLGESGTIDSLSATEQTRLRQRYLEEQLRAERRILEFLDEDQVAELRERLPEIWVFEPGGNTSISYNHTDGF